MKTLAVVGAGASGTLAAVHALRAGQPLRLVLIDHTGTFGPGVAYRTTDPRHLLNTPAKKMSALESDPAHFVRWSRAHGFPVDTDPFVPRGEYGRYLTETLLAEERATAGRVTLERITDTAVGLSTSAGQATIALAHRAPITADAVVLAPGVETADPFHQLGTARYIADPWRAGALDVIGRDEPALIVGTGLTMLDLANSLAARTRAALHAVSRHGLLPFPHPLPPRSAAPAAAVPDTVSSLGGLLRYARAAVAEDPQRWPEIVDQLRPHTATLWQRLDVAERRRFLARVNRFWDVHRHRAAPGTHRQVRELLGSGRLIVHRGHVETVHAVPGGLVADLGHRTLAVGRLVNATGFGTDVTANCFLRELLTSGIACPDALGLGLRTGDDGRVLPASGRPQQVFTLGALRRGELFESTAVPEIRAQAAAISAAVLR